MKKARKFTKPLIQISVLVFTIALLIVLPLKTFYKPKNEYKGTYIVTYFDSFDEHKDLSSSERIKLESGQTYFLKTEGEASNTSLSSGSYIKVMGTIENETLTASAISEVTDDPAHPKESHAAGTSKKVAVIKFNFTDNKTDPVSTSKLNSVFFNDSTSLNNFYTTDSYGKFLGIDQASFKMVNSGAPYTVAYKMGSCKGGILTSGYPFEYWARDAFLQAGGSTAFTNYDLMIFVFPRLSSSLCDFDAVTEHAGSGSIIGKDYIVANGDIVSADYAHEMGHILGLGHANKCSDINCVNVTRYGDPNDTMGICCSKPGPFNSSFKTTLGWISPYTAAVTETGTSYNLYAIESKTSNVQSLQFPKLSTGERYFLTYRNKTGTFANNGTVPTVVVSVYTQRVAPDDIILNNAFSSYFVGEYKAGQTFTDTINGIEMKVNSLTTSYANLTIKKVAGSQTGQGTIIPTSPPTGGTATPLPNLDIGGYVWDTNMKGVSGMKMAIEGYGSSGSWKAYNPITNSDGFFKQGGFIVYGGQYNVKADGIVKTLTYALSRDTVTGLDTPQGSLAYMNQKGDFNDCAHVSSFRCNFLAQKPLDTPATIADVTSFIWQSSNPANKNKYSYRRTYLSTDGKTFYRKDCFFDRLVEYPVICSGYQTGTVDTPGPVKGYGAFVFPQGGSKQWIRQSYLGTDGTTYYWRVCQWDVTSGQPVANTCEPYSSVQVTTPTAVKSVETTFASGYLYQTFISSDGKKEYRRSCAFNMTTFASSGCTGFTTTTLPATMNGNSEFIYQGGYNEMKVQQFYVGSDGRKPYFRTCNWSGSGTSAKPVCPAFI